MSNEVLRTRTLQEGKTTIPALADLFQQVYLKPTPEGNSQYKAVVLSGEEPEEKDLSHFITDDSDRMLFVETPAGEVRAIILNQRADFETALCCIGHRCKQTEIPKTQGASILDGVINWQKIKDHKKEWLKTHEEEGWDEEFASFTSDRKNVTDALILLSSGPYSAIQASRVNRSEQQWLKDSLVIRMVHECTHFICRRLYKEKINPIFDELTADAAGIIAAYGSYDPVMAETFLGINGETYTGGRLENYVKEPTSENLSALSKDVHTVITRMATMLEPHQDRTAFDQAVVLEEGMETLLEGIVFPS